MDNIAFVQKVKMLCLEKDLKPSNVCAECGLGSSFLPDIKRGRVPSVDKVERLAAYLGVTTSELLGEEKALPTVADEERLDQELIERLCQLSPEELEKVDAFVQGLLAAR